jgi:hypothetical protein
LLDPALSGEQARLARWDFSAAQIERMVHGGSDAGIHLRLKWHVPPSHDRLMVVVRYALKDGTWLEAKQIIAVATGEAASQPEIAPRRPDPRDLHQGSDQRQPSDQHSTRPERPQWSPDRD